jgi:hypothetical protein
VISRHFTLVIVGDDSARTAAIQLLEQTIARSTWTTSSVFCCCTRSAHRMTSIATPPRAGQQAERRPVFLIELTQRRSAILWARRP